MNSTLLARTARRFAAPLMRKVGRMRFDSSQKYWSQRYADGLTSGAGSYGALADFKAQTLNNIVAEHHVRSVVEFGCGDGNQLGLAEYPVYVGLDVAPGAIDLCVRRYANDRTKSFFLYDPQRFVDHAKLFRADLAMSLDVIFHLVEDEAFDTHMRHLFGSAERLVAIWSSDSAVADPAPHVKNRPFTPWILAHAPEWALLVRIDNPHRGLHGSVSDLYIFHRTAAPEPLPSSPEQR